MLGDICRNVEEGILPQCDEVMSILVTNLGREDVHRTIKPQILSSFGDIALVVGEKFDKYVDAVLRVLKQAMALSVQSAQAAGGWRAHEPGRGVSNTVACLASNISSCCVPCLIKFYGGPTSSGHSAPAMLVKLQAMFTVDTENA